MRGKSLNHNYGKKNSCDRDVILFFVMFAAGSPAALCQLHVDDEIIAINGTKISHMDYSQWEEAISRALETGNLVMDVRRYGKTGELFHQADTVCSARQISFVSMVPGS